MTHNESLSVGGTVISEVDFSRVSQNDVAAWLTYDSLMNAESPLTPFQLARDSLGNLPDLVTVRLFVARDPDGAVAADGRAVVTSAIEDNQACQIHVSVRPDRRGRGIGKALLKLVAEAAEAENRTILVGWSTDRIAAGRDFARCLGAARVLDLVINKLLVSEINGNTVERWIAQGSMCAREYSLIEIAGPYPSNMVAALLDLRIIGNNGLPTFLHERPIFSVEAMRAVETTLTGGRQRLSLVAVHQPTGAIVGYTEVFYHRTNRRGARHAGTAVHPSHRGHGVGKWLKAEMLERIVTVCPGVEEIITANVASNEVILSINHALGFKPSMVATAWQAPVACVREAL